MKDCLIVNYGLTSAYTNIYVVVDGKIKEELRVSSSYENVADSIKKLQSEYNIFIIKLRGQEQLLDVIEQIIHEQEIQDYSIERTKFERI